MDRVALMAKAELHDIAGRQLDVRVVGEGSDRPRLVFLHEGLGSVDLWRDVPAAICRSVGMRGVVYSRYGHGWSEVQRKPRPVDFMDTEAYEVLPALLDRFGVTDPILIGHSDGASISLVHASRHSVRGLALLAPHVLLEPDGLDKIRDMVEGFAESELAARLARYHMDPAATFAAWSGVWLRPEFLSWNIEHLLEGVVAPSILIQGEDDEYDTGDQVDVIAEKIGGHCDRLFLSNCRHSPQFDRPATTAAAIVGFIDDLEAG